MSQLAIVAKQLEDVFDTFSNTVPTPYNDKFSSKQVFLLIEIFILLQKLTIDERNFLINHLKQKYNG
jgi:hypothetical protein